jgi:hypothetical protein
MKVKELIEKLKKFDENMEVKYDLENSFPTGEITCLYKEGNTVNIF